MGDVAADHQRAGEREASLDRVLRELGTDVSHRLIQVNFDRRCDDSLVLGRLGQEVCRVLARAASSEDAFAVDLGQDLAVSRARHGEADRARRAVAGQTDDPHVVAEVLAAELGADAELAGHFENASFPFDVAVGVAGLAAFGRQRIEITRGRKLGHLDAYSADVPPMTMPR